VDPTVKAFLIGFRQGREGMPLTPPVTMTEQELADLESAKPPPSAHLWMWHMIGWNCGQGIAQFEMARP
jgi:hypothetical protein